MNKKLELKAKAESSRESGSAHCHRFSDHQVIMNSQKREKVKILGEMQFLAKALCLKVKGKLRRDGNGET